MGRRKKKEREVSVSERSEILKANTLLFLIQYFVYSLIYVEDNI